jgi:hypothetical protein
MVWDGRAGGMSSRRSDGQPAALPAPMIPIRTSSFFARPVKKEG